MMFKFFKSHNTTNIPETTVFSFKKFTWTQFKKNRLAFYSFYLLVALIGIAILSPILSNDKPLYCKVKGTIYFPAFTLKNNYQIENETITVDYYDWKHKELESVVWAVCAYSPGTSDALNSSLSPFDTQVFKKSNGELIQMPSKFKHRWGTTKDGSDVLAGVIHGVRYSLLIGILSMLIAAIIGLTLGSLSGYFGNSGLQTTRGKYWMLLIGLFFAYYYAFHVRSYTLSDALETGGINLIVQLILSILIFCAILFCFYLIGKYISKYAYFKATKIVKIDAFISRIIEINNSIPLFLIILAIAAIAQPSFVTLVLLIGLSNWSLIARLTRGEFLRISALEYIQAARALGLKNRAIIVRHVLPNAIAPAFVAIAFGIAGAILTESGLSFLGVGVPPEIVTWGKLLGEAKENAGSWWLIVFPGSAIFVTVTMYNLIGEGLRDALDPRLKK